MTKKKLQIPRRSDLIVWNQFVFPRLCPFNVRGGFTPTAGSESLLSDFRVHLRFGGEEVGARPYAVEPDEPYDLLHIGALGVNGVVVKTEHLADFIEESWRLTLRRVRHKFCVITSIHC